MAEAQRKRWAAVRNESEPPSESPKPKRKLSAAGRKRIIEATKKRWAAVRAAKAAEKNTAAVKRAVKRTGAKSKSGTAQTAAQ
jgi:hypothetical protein